MRFGPGVIGSVVALCACAGGSSEPRPTPRVLDVTHGTITRHEARWLVREPAVRAVAPGSSGNKAQLDFVYRGPTDELVRLASGAERAQLGIKLRAQDGCNVLYVMWRVDPSAVTVQLKRNAGARDNDDCGNRGYRWLHATSKASPPLMTPGVPHRLAAAVEDNTLTVIADGAVVWRGILPADARELRGPAGFRTDNVRVDLELATE